MSFMLPTGIAVGPGGKVYVADGDAHRILVFPPLEEMSGAPGAQ
jgi:DNA-binding beta-propeller fold protein YncE